MNHAKSPFRLAALALLTVAIHLPHAAPLGTAFSYQGLLIQGSSPATGRYDLTFALHKDAVAAAQVGTTQTNLNLAVSNGVFTTTVDFGAGIFDGTAYWLAIGVRSNGTGVAFTNVSPRQAVMPSPYALFATVAPVANNSVSSAKIMDGAITTADLADNSVTSSKIVNGSVAGVDIANGAISPLKLDASQSFAMGGVIVAGSGAAAGRFSNPDGAGVYSTSARNRSVSPSTDPAELSAIRGESLQGIGVYGRGDVSNAYSFYNEGGYFEGGKGLYARGTGTVGQQGYGARIFSDNYRGMYVQGGSGWFDAYFGGNSGISVNGITDRAAALASLAVNLGDSEIEPGDLVALAGVGTSPENGQPVLGVAKLTASNRDAVIGVAVSAFAVKTVAHENRPESVEFSPATGGAMPSSFLSIVTSGLAPAVKLESAAMVGMENAAIGDKIELTSDGKMLLSGVASDGVSTSAVRSPADKVISIGKVAAPVNKAKGTVVLFLKID